VCVCDTIATFIDDITKIGGSKGTGCNARMHLLVRRGHGSACVLMAVDTPKPKEFIVALFNKREREARKEEEGAKPKSPRVV